MVLLPSAHSFFCQIILPKSQSLLSSLPSCRVSLGLWRASSTVDLHYFVSRLTWNFITGGVGRVCRVYYLPPWLTFFTFYGNRRLWKTSWCAFDHNLALGRSTVSFFIHPFPIKKNSHSQSITASALTVVQIQAIYSVDPMRISSLLPSCQWCG